MYPTRHTSMASRDPSDLVEVIEERPNLTRLVDFVRDDCAGAIATFSGTTRNNFTGNSEQEEKPSLRKHPMLIHLRLHMKVNGVNKRVLQLSYEAYVPMAVSQLRLILSEARVRYPSVLRIAVSHRTGEVPVGMESVIIAASSPQRKEALDATGWILNELKRRVPIWKKEHYEDGSVWKGNVECDWKSIAQ
ncbi:Molybdopterin synthase catalytic subunit [Thoreauomyces humboldtii]|nr:Molybdopterin synthase catalytic subunit [Thoreauomyces humboldtii]